MNILIFFSSKKFMKICSKTHQFAPSKKFSLGSMPPNPPSKRPATPRVASSFAACKLAQPPQKLTPLAKSYILPWTTSKKFI